MASDAPDRCRPPVFIVAPTGKSGTNFLYHALQAIGLCEPASKNFLRAEDFLLCHSHLLREYVTTTATAWRKYDGRDIVDRGCGELLSRLGDALLSFIGDPQDPRRRVVLKTPTATGIDNLFDLMPNAKLILLVRDGRDVAESQIRSGYATNYDSVFKNWANKTRLFLHFMQKQRAAPESWKLVRFEDLIAQPESTLVEIGSFLDRMAPEIDMDSINALPLYGSIDGEEADFAWKVKDKPADFNPVGRWRCWNEARCALFEEIAGAELIELGYEDDRNWSCAT